MANDHGQDLSCSNRYGLRVFDLGYQLYVSRLCILPFLQSHPITVPLLPKTGLMTGVVMWITISAVQGRRRIPADLFGIPITALFALPTVRSIMPGAPFFGELSRTYALPLHVTDLSGLIVGCILDYGGIILNLLVLTICVRPRVFPSFLPFFLEV